MGRIEGGNVYRTKSKLDYPKLRAQDSRKHDELKWAPGDREPTFKAEMDTSGVDAWPVDATWKV